MRQAPGIEMAGFFKLATSFEKRRMHLGYRRATWPAPMPGHRRGRAAARTRVSLCQILEHTMRRWRRWSMPRTPPSPETGSSKSFNGGGRVTGSFFHLIAEAT